MAKRPKSLTFQKRVQDRVKALGESPITLATKVGLRREFIRDIVEGRKFSVSARSLNLVAQALQCDARYLTGDLDQPWPDQKAPVFSEEATILAGPGPTKTDGALLTFAGICWSGMWQSLEAPPRVRPVQLAPDPRYPEAPQVVYRLEGVAMFEQARDSFVIGIAADLFTQYVGPISSGVFVVLKRFSKDRKAVELSVRVVERTSSGTRLTDVSGTQPVMVLEQPPKGEVLSIDAVLLIGTQLMV